MTATQSEGWWNICKTYGLLVLASRPIFPICWWRTWRRPCVFAWFCTCLSSLRTVIFAILLMHYSKNMRLDGFDPYTRIWCILMCSKVGLSRVQIRQLQRAVCEPHARRRLTLCLARSGEMWLAPAGYGSRSEIASETTDFVCFSVDQFRFFQNLCWFTACSILQPSWAQVLLPFRLWEFKRKTLKLQFC